MDKWSLERSTVGWAIVYPIGGPDIEAYTPVHAGIYQYSKL